VAGVGLKMEAEMTIEPEDKPFECFSCRSKQYWMRSDGARICQRCHPNPNADAHIDPFHRLLKRQEGARRENEANSH